MAEWLLLLTAAAAPMASGNVQSLLSEEQLHQIDVLRQQRAQQNNNNKRLKFLTKPNYGHGKARSAIYKRSRVVIQQPRPGF